MDILFAYHLEVIVDNDEFNETMIQLERIKREALAFVEDYFLHVKGIKTLHPLEYKRRYAFSPLKYFHRELGLEGNEAGSNAL